MLKKIYRILISFLYRFKFFSSGFGLRIHFPIKLHYSKNIKIGNNVSIFENTWFNCIDSEDKPSLIIGDNCSIGRFAHINAYKSVVIENNVVIAERVHISDCSHNYSLSDKPIIDQGTEFVEKVLIKSGSWIGSGAVILPGVSIGKNAIVGANAVVSSDVPDYHIARGVPAKNYQNKKYKNIK